DRVGRLGDGEIVQVARNSADFDVHSPSPGFMAGHGSARGSDGALILAVTLAACLAAAATSSGNCAKALSRPARRASASINSLSIACILQNPSPLLQHESRPPVHGAIMARLQRKIGWLPTKRWRS